jgi:hypothetical protein
MKRLILIVMFWVLVIPAGAQEVPADTALAACTMEEAQQSVQWMEDNGMFDQLEGLQAIEVSPDADASQLYAMAVILNINWQTGSANLVQCHAAQALRLAYSEYLSDLVTRSGLVFLARTTEQQGGDPTLAEDFLFQAQETAWIRWSLYELATFQLRLIAGEDAAEVFEEESAAAATESPPETWYITANANGRACPETSCEILVSFTRGQNVLVVGEASGQNVQGSTVWKIVRYPTGDVYVHSTLLSQTAQSSAPAQPTVRPAAAATQAPVSQPTEPISLPATFTPLPPPPPTPVPQGATCPGFEFTCSQLTCEQAYACLAAGKSSLDRDSDGVPCESICPGG